MRKFLALALAILMLAAFSVMPIAAATDFTVRPLGVTVEGGVKTANFDLTTSDKSTNGNVATKDLIVTEVSFNSSYSNGVKGTVPVEMNLYNYIEIYNRGTAPVDLSKVAIVQMNDRGTGDNEENIWDVNANFNAGGTSNAKVLPLSAGANIYDDCPGMTSAQATSRYTKAPVDNPASVVLQPGEFAIVWLWDDNCVNASSDQWKSGEKADGTSIYTAGEGKSIAAPQNGRTNFPNFRDHYASMMGIDKYKNGTTEFTPEFQQLEDTLILAAHCDTNLTIKFYDYSSMIYALVDADNFDATTIEYVDLRTGEISPYVYSFFGWGTSDRHGILGSVEDVATIYVPSASAADLYWGYKKQEFGADKAPAAGASQAEIDAYNQAVENYNTYVQQNFDYVALGISNSYLEMAVMSASETPSIGTMPSYQWKYVDPAQMAEYAEDGDTAYISDWEKSWDADTRNTAIQDATTGELVATWETDVITALIADRVVELEDADKEAAAERDEVFIDKDWWMNQQDSNAAPDEDDDTNSGSTNNDKDKKPTKNNITQKPWFWILVIGAPVLLLGGAAAVVIFVILPKKKKAMDDVAPEDGEVTVIDETTTEAPAEEEAPVEETPVEEAPTEETTTEE